MGSVCPPHLPGEMKFTAPSGYDFEIPDDWLREAGVDRRTARYRVHDPQGQSRWLQLRAIITSHRHIGHFAPPGPFERHRMIHVLRELSNRVELWPVDVWPLEQQDGPHEFQLFHGYHRYHACIVMGLTEIAAYVHRKGDLVADPEPPCRECGGPLRRLASGSRPLRMCECCGSVTY